jgi:hypothetical protein
MQTFHSNYILSIQLRHIYVFTLLIMLEISLTQENLIGYVTVSYLQEEVYKCKGTPLKILNENIFIYSGSAQFVYFTTIYRDYFEPKFDGLSCILIPL